MASPPTRGNCDTTFGGWCACKHLTFCAGEPDGCKVNHEPVGDTDACDQFECDPEVKIALI